MLQHADLLSHGLFGMQRPSEIKRRKISDTAARLFATRPFHKVRLDDVAAAAHVGKGTLYIYFKSKEDLYVSLVEDGFSQLVTQLRESADAPPPEALREIVRQLVAFAFSHPHFFELLRTVPHLTIHSGLLRMRKELSDFIARTLRRGVRQGVWSDAHPELTAIFIPGMVRSAMLYGPRDLEQQRLTDQILSLINKGIGGDAK